MNRCATLLVLALMAGCADQPHDSNDSDWADQGFAADTDVTMDVTDTEDMDVNDTDSADTTGALGVGQGGAQDFGQLKQILEDGGIPGPETFDDVGFFNEHRIEFPLPTCGEDVCIHGRFGSLGNMITGADCTIVLLGLNTPINPAELERPPLNLTIAVDTSGSMSGQPMQYVRTGLRSMLEELRPEDHVSIVTFSNSAEVVADYLTGNDPALDDIVRGLQASGGTDIHEGLTLAMETLDGHALPETQNRLIFLSDGRATAGIQSQDAILGVASDYAEQGYTIATIGMGDNFDVELMRGMSEIGAGAFYFLQDEAAVAEVFTEELSYFLVPLAEDITIDVQAATGWNLRGVFGTRLFALGNHRAVIDIPNLQVAHRTSSGDQATGRRGGGGALMVELLPGLGTPDGNAADITFEYTIPGSDERVVQTATVASPLEGTASPAEGAFDDEQVEKSFVMLNLYVGLRSAAALASSNDYEGALAVLTPLRDNVTQWVALTGDEDILDDLRYVEMFVDNLQAAGTEEPTDWWEDGDDDWIWD